MALLLMTWVTLKVILLFEIFVTPIPFEIYNTVQYLSTTVCLHVNTMLPMACNFNCRVDTEWFLGDRLYNSSPYAIGPLSCPVCLSVTLVYCGQTIGWFKVKLGMKVGLGPGHIVLDGDPAPPPPKGQSPQFSVHICCGQMAGWIKTVLGTEVGLVQATLCQMGTHLPSPKKGQSSQIFRPLLLWPNG